MRVIIDVKVSKLLQDSDTSNRREQLIVKECANVVRVTIFTVHHGMSTQGLIEKLWGTLILIVKIRS